jgi:glyoxylase-like metal-dependent hydrolase (beta-lactamase superfamily II)
VESPPSHPSSPTSPPSPTSLVSVLEGIHRWSVWNEPRKLWFNGHLLHVGEQWVAIDPVELSDEVVAAIEALGKPSLCVITNRDHERAAAAFGERFGARVVVPRHDAAAMAPAIAEHPFHPGDVLAGELRAIAVADAKSPGETALHWPARRLLVLGDAAVGRPAGALSMLPADKFADLPAARAGVAQLAELDIDILLVGDGEDLLTGGTAALHALREGPARAPFSAGKPGC